MGGGIALGLRAIGNAWQDMEDAFKPFGPSMELKARVLGWLWQEFDAADPAPPDAPGPVPPIQRQRPLAALPHRPRWTFSVPGFLPARRCP